MYPYNAKSDGVAKSDQKSDESIEERVKLTRQKSDDKADEGDNHDQKADTTNIPDIESEESAT